MSDNRRSLRYIIYILLATLLLFIYVWQRSYTFKLMRDIERLKRDMEVWDKKVINKRIEYEKEFSPLKFNRGVEDEQG